MTGSPGSPAMGFIGVDTTRSSIMRVFPLWAEHLGLPTRRLLGHDVPLGAGDDVYRELVERIRRDPDHLGALVTSHKIRVFEAAHDLFDELDELSRQCGEISSISKQRGRLVGAAKDPVTAGLAMSEILPGDFFEQGGTALCLGAGGAGTAITTHLATTDHPPNRLVVTDVDEDRLGHLRRVHERVGLDRDAVHYVLTSGQQQATALVEQLPPHSLVVNATGLGKDRPGSPVAAEVTFPVDCVVWEINYRGSLDFLRAAEAQQHRRRLEVHDGWRYFVHGWTHVVAEVFHLDLTSATVDELSRLAETVR